MRSLVLLAFVLFVTACTSKPTQDKSSSYPLPPPSPADDVEVSIDYPSLQRFLGMEKDRDSLGFYQKPFNTCDAGFGFSRSQNCRQEFLTVIQFRLLCRDSEGTISNILSDSDLTPLGQRNIRWNLKGIQGTVQSDSDGYGQIVTSSRMPQQGQRLRLAIGNEFLYMRASEIKKVITPRPWCSQY